MSTIEKQSIDSVHYIIVTRALDNLTKEMRKLDYNYKFTDSLNEELSEQLTRLDKTYNCLQQQYNELRKILNIQDDSKVDYTNTTPACIYIKEFKSKDLESWKDAIEETCNYLITTDKNKFNQMTKEVFGKKRLYFSNNQYQLKSARYLDKMEIFVETNFSAQASVQFIEKILTFYDISTNDLKIELKNK